MSHTAGCNGQLAWARVGGWADYASCRVGCLFVDEEVQFEKSNTLLAREYALSYNNVRFILPE